MTPARTSIPAPVPAAALEHALDERGTGSMLPARRTHPTPRSRGSANTSSPQAGSASVAPTASRLPGARRALAVGDDAIVLVRGDDGTLRGFFNVCRHRGSELLPCGTTATRAAIHCPYHGWTYALDGSLRATPRFAAPAGFDPEAFGLVPVRVAEWHGWVMVNVSGDAPPLDDWFGGLEELIVPYDCGSLVVGATHEYTVAANWKLPIENFHECYHCPAIHPELCTVSPPTSGANFDRPGAWFGGTMDLAAHAQTMSMTGASEGVLLPGLDATRRRQVLYVGVFPNLLLSLHPDYVMTHRIEPRAPGRVLRRVSMVVPSGSPRTR